MEKIIVIFNKKLLLLKFLMKNNGKNVNFTLRIKFIISIVLKLIKFKNRLKLKVKLKCGMLKENKE